MPKNKFLFPFILVCTLFFLWAFLHNINGILIPHLKKVCQLSDTQSSLIDFAVYFGYFVIAIPAGLFSHRFGYKKGILFGLFLFALGALLFFPAASERNFIFFFSGVVRGGQRGYFPGDGCESLCRRDGAAGTFGAAAEFCSIF